MHKHGTYNSLSSTSLLQKLYTNKTRKRGIISWLLKESKRKARNKMLLKTWRVKTLRNRACFRGFFYCFQTDMEICQKELNSPCIMEQSLLGERDQIFHKSSYTVHSYALLLLAADSRTKVLLFSASLRITPLCSEAAMGSYKIIQHASISGTGACNS